MSSSQAQLQMQAQHCGGCGGGRTCSCFIWEARTPARRSLPTSGPPTMAWTAGAQPPAKSTRDAHTALSQEHSQEHCLRSALRSTVSGALSGALSRTISGALSQEHCLRSTVSAALSQQHSHEHSQEHCLRSTVSAALSHEHSQRNPCHAETLCPGRWQQPSVSLRDGAVHDFVNTAVLPSRGVSFWLPSLVGLVGVRTCDAVEGRGADGGGPVLQASERGL